MSVLQAAPVNPLGSANRGDDLVALESVLDRSITSAERVGAGRNSRVYHVRCDSDEFAAKFYFGPTADGRNRLEVEFSALEFLWRRGLRCIPQPLKADVTRHLALYQFVAGQPMDARRVTFEELGQVLSFLEQLRQIEPDSEARALPAGAEAFFTVAGLIGNVQSRLGRLRGVVAVGAAYDALLRFLSDEFTPALDQFGARAEATSFGELAWEDRVLSPSDLGFHNALRSSDGRVTFLDFEYFGWDDPAKTLCDAQLHPQMQLSAAHRLRLAEGCAAIFGSDPAWHDRVEALYPLFALKWCLILLNEFRPEQIARRRYVDRSHNRTHIIQMRQLNAARAALARIIREDGRFPYWKGGT